MENETKVIVPKNNDARIRMIFDILILILATVALITSISNNGGFSSESEISFSDPNMDMDVMPISDQIPAEE